MFKNSIIYIVSSSLSKATPFLLLPLLMSYLTTEEMGNISIFFSLVTFFLIICGLSCDGVVSVDYFKLGKDKVRSSVGAIGLILIITSSILVLGLFLFKDFLHRIAEIEPTYLLLAVIIASCQIVTFINLALWQAERNAIKFGIYEVCQSVINISLSLYFVVLMKYGDDGRILGFSISYFCFAFLSIFLLFKRKYISFSINLAHWKAILSFGILLIPHALALWIMLNISRFLLANFMGISQVGIYFVATQLAAVITIIALATQKAYVPYIYQLLSDVKNAGKNKRKVVRSAYIYFLSILLMAFALYVAVSFLISEFAESKYKEAVVILPWIILGVIFHAWGIFFTNIILYTKKTYYLSGATFSAAFFHLILAYFLIKHYGLQGAAVSFFLSNLMSFILSSISARLVLPLPWTSSNIRRRTWLFFRKNLRLQRE